MTFDEAVNKYLDEHGDFGTAMHFGQAMYEAGKAASRRPVATIQYWGKMFGLFDKKDMLIKCGFPDKEESKEWARSNGYEVC